MLRRKQVAFTAVSSTTARMAQQQPMHWAANPLVTSTVRFPSNTAGSSADLQSLRLRSRAASDRHVAALWNLSRARNRVVVAARVTFGIAAFVVVCAKEVVAEASGEAAEKQAQRQLAAAMDAFEEAKRSKATAEAEAEAATVEATTAEAKAANEAAEAKAAAEVKPAELLSRVVLRSEAEPYVFAWVRAKAAVESVTVDALLDFDLCRQLAGAKTLPKLRECLTQATVRVEGKGKGKRETKRLVDCTIAEASRVPASAWPPAASALREALTKLWKGTATEPTKATHVYGSGLTFDMGSVLSSRIVGAAHSRVVEDIVADIKARPTGHTKEHNTPLFLTSVPRNSKSAILQAVGHRLANEAGYVSVFVTYNNNTGISEADYDPARLAPRFFARVAASVLRFQSDVPDDRLIDEFEPFVQTDCELGRFLELAGFNPEKRPLFIAAHGFGRVVEAVTRTPDARRTYRKSFAQVSYLVQDRDALLFSVVRVGDTAGCGHRPTRSFRVPALEPSDRIGTIGGGARAAAVCASCVPESTILTASEAEMLLLYAALCVHLNVRFEASDRLWYEAAKTSAGALACALEVTLTEDEPSGMRDAVRRLACTRQEAGSSLEMLLSGLALQLRQPGGVFRVHTFDPPSTDATSVVRELEAESLLIVEGHTFNADGFVAPLALTAVMNSYSNEGFASDDAFGRWIKRGYDAYAAAVMEAVGTPPKGGGAVAEALVRLAVRGRLLAEGLHVIAASGDTAMNPAVDPAAVADAQLASTQEEVPDFRVDAFPDVDSYVTTEMAVEPVLRAVVAAVGSALELTLGHGNKTKLRRDVVELLQQPEAAQGNAGCSRQQVLEVDAICRVRVAHTVCREVLGKTTGARKRAALKAKLLELWAARDGTTGDDGMAGRLLGTDITLGEARDDVVAGTRAEGGWREKRLAQIVAVCAAVVESGDAGRRCAACIHSTGANRGSDYAVIKAVEGRPRTIDVDLYEVKYGFSPKMSAVKDSDARKGMREVCAALGAAKGIKVRNVTHHSVILAKTGRTQAAAMAAGPKEEPWNAWATKEVGARELLTPTLAALLRDEDLVG